MQPIADWKRQVQELHRESYMWSLCCCNYDRDTAKDVLQTVYLKIYEERARFSQKSELKTWLFSVIRFTSLDYFRKHALHIEPLNEDHQEIPIPEASAEIESEELFMNLLQSLSSQQREVLTLAFYHDLTLEEIARLMELSIGTARTHYERGKANVKRLLLEKKLYAEFL